MALPEVPLVFTKQSTSANGPNSPIYWSEEGQAMDYEGELPWSLPEIVDGFRAIRPKASFSDFVWPMMSVFEIGKCGARRHRLRWASLGTVIAR